MSQSNNINLLQQLLDKHVYSLFTEKQLEDLSADDKIITTDLSWQDINLYFPNKSSFLSSIKIYGETIFQRIDSEDNFEAFSLITRCRNIGEKVQIRHAAAGLKLYLYRNPETMIYNTYLKEILIKAFERYNMQGSALYSILSKGYNHSCTPEELKEMLGVNYINSMLKSRVLSPAENIVHELFNDGQIPFYFNIDLRRSVIGRGSKIIEINFEIIDNIVLLRLKRNRPTYMSFILAQLIELFPFDYPFLEEDIKKVDDKTVEKIYMMIKHIEDDPDYLKIANSTLIRWKLQTLFNIASPTE